MDEDESFELMMHDGLPRILFALAKRLSVVVMEASQSIYGGAVL